MTEYWGQGWAYKDNLLGSCRGCQLSKKDCSNILSTSCREDKKIRAKKSSQIGKPGANVILGNEIKRMKGVSLLSSLSMSSLE